MADANGNNSILFFFLFYLFKPVHGEKLERLLPEKLLVNEILHHMESAVYLLQNLEKQCSYELRISYPATVPTEFLIKLMNSTEYSRNNNGRKLLNTEKIVFENDQHNEQYAKVTAIRTGVPLHSSRLQDPVIYNIVLEKLYLGLPWEVWKTGMFIVITLAIIMKYVLPQLQKYFELQRLQMQKQLS
ncbi:uncharacterized protein LOC116293231 [Actinia tenebrosa]|uniref:Uncharacterized protein LOC116293231 n=1 Tax=Actinia tenebrosa TaxID=6105 RepID=A0A6P8HL61_ACTTE|nr:uncharacterized protein LOC116293231 [Actinia tenebrosa]